jgi:hypothetical protein
VEGWVPAAGQVALGFSGAVLLWLIAAAAVPGFALPFEREEGVESARHAELVSGGGRWLCRRRGGGDGRSGRVELGKTSDLGHLPLGQLGTIWAGLFSRRPWYGYSHSNKLRDHGTDTTTATNLLQT